MYLNHPCYSLIRTFPLDKISQGTVASQDLPNGVQSISVVSLTTVVDGAKLIGPSTVSVEGRFFPEVTVILSLERRFQCDCPL